jgi:hypothetical protein
MIAHTSQVDFPPAMGGKTSELLFDMRIVQISQPKFENASPSGLYVEVVNTDKDRLQYSVPLSLTEHASIQFSSSQFICMLLSHSLPWGLSSVTFLPFDSSNQLACMKSQWRLSGSAEHSSLRLSCTLQGNTGVQDFIAYRKAQPDERRGNPKDGNDQDGSDDDGNDRRRNATTSFASASERTSFSACSIQ